MPHVGPPLAAPTPPATPSVARPQRIPPALRLVLLGVLALGLIAVVRLTPLQEWFGEERLRAFVEAAGPWAIPGYIVLYAVCLAMWIPGTVVTLVGAALFPAHIAVPTTYAGALGGAILGFGIARGIGGDALQRVLQNRWAGYTKYQQKLERRGFETVVILRLLPTPYNLVSYLAGLSPIPARHYVIATSLGILPGSIAFTLLLGSVIQAFRAGDWMAIFSWQTLASTTLFLPVIAMPRILRWGRRRFGWFGGPEDETFDETAPSDADREVEAGR